MKSIVIFALFLVSANAIDSQVVDAFVAKLAKFSQQCMEETKATPEDLAKLMAHEEPDSHEGKCIVSCVYKAFKVQNEDGTMNSEETKKFMEKVKESDEEMYNKLMEVYDKCKGVAEQVDDDPCITAFNVAKCAVKEGKAVGLDKEMLGM